VLDPGLGGGVGEVEVELVADRVGDDQVGGVEQHLAALPGVDLPAVVEGALARHLDEAPLAGGGLATEVGARVGPDDDVAVGALGAQLGVGVDGGGVGVGHRRVGAVGVAADADGAALGGAVGLHAGGGQVHRLPGDGDVAAALAVGAHAAGDERRVAAVDADGAALGRAVGGDPALGGLQGAMAGVHRHRAAIAVGMDGTGLDDALAGQADAATGCAAGVQGAGIDQPVS